jgi:nicotinate-nucleotide adenylyltransferase
MPRPGVARSAVEQAVPEAHWLEAPLLDLSGTMIRDRRRAGKSIRFLVPDGVLAYIEAAGLYGIP